MNRSQIAELSFADTAAIALSFVCLIHCLFLPLVVPALPLMIAADERAFHIVLALALLLLAALAFWRGFKRHQKRSVLYAGAVGTALLLTAVSLPDHHMHHHLTSERLLTAFGGIILMAAHWVNIRSCTCELSDDRCGCAG